MYLAHLPRNTNKLGTKSDRIHLPLVEKGAVELSPNLTYLVPNRYCNLAELDFAYVIA